MLSQQSDAFVIESGISDWVSDGLFSHSTSELRPGFVIDAQDVVLDVGCGQGSDALFCAERGAEVIFVDVNKEEVEETARRLAGTPARKLIPIVSDCNPLPVADGTATKVVASEVLEHVDDPAQFLSELVRAGAPGALYMLAVPDPVLEELQIGLAAPAHFEKPNHIRIIGRHEFARMVTDAGLVIERRGSYGFYWSIWWLMFWICKVDIFESHPMLESWEKTWRSLLALPASLPLRTALNEVLPKSQYIIARKPARRTRKLEILSNTLSSIRTLLSGAAIPEQSRRAPPVPTAVQAEAVAPVSTEDTLNSKFVGLHDDVESGWFKFTEGELFKDFPITATDTVLDVGCGEGGHAAACAKLGAHVIFTDVTENIVARAARAVAETGIADFTPIVSDSKPLPLDDGSVSRILALEVLEYVEDPVAFLRELTRVGKPGARYLISVSDPVQGDILRHIAPSELFAKPEADGALVRGVPAGHLHMFGRDEFERMVTSAGLVVERVNYVGFYGALWSLFFWVCNVDFRDPRHPLLVQWARTWKMVLECPDGHKVKSRLDSFMPKRQILIAWKP